MSKPITRILLFAPIAILLCVLCMSSPLLSALTSSPSAPSGRPKMLGIVGVSLISSDFPKSQVFYGNVLGLTRTKAKLEATDSTDPRCDFNSGRCFLTSRGQAVSLLSPCGVEGPCETNFLFAVTIETSDAAGLRELLKASKIPVSEMRENGKAFTAIDPDRHRIHFIETSALKRSGDANEHPSEHSLIHAGFVVRDRVAMDHFYKDILGFRVYWHGGMKDDETSWVDMQVPDGTDWIEYMLNVSDNASHKTLGVMNHIALGVPNIHAAQQQLLKNGWKGTEKPQIGRDGKWQLNLYDPDGTRVELMEFTPVEKPCCSEYTGPHPKP